MKDVASREPPSSGGMFHASSNMTGSMSGGRVGLAVRSSVSGHMDGSGVVKGRVAMTESWMRLPLRLSYTRCSVGCSRN